MILHLTQSAISDIVAAHSSQLSHCNLLMSLCVYVCVCVCVCMCVCVCVRERGEEGGSRTHEV